MWHLITQIYDLIIYHPILNLLVAIYNHIPGHDFGVVIIVVTVVIRLILAPFMHKSLKGQRAMSALQPKLAELKEIHKGDSMAHQKATMDLYKEHNINPFSSCLPMLIQLPVLIALYQVFRKALHMDLTGLYSFVHNPGTINPMMFGHFDLSHPNIAFAIIAGVVQFLQSWMMTRWQNGPVDGTAKAMNAQMMYLLPAVSVYIAWKLPAGLPLYWIVTTLFAIAQQVYINYRHPMTPAKPAVIEGSATVK